jgi:signal transduction histidine kinase
MSDSKIEFTFLVCLSAGFGLMFALWLYDSANVGFFLLLCMMMTSLLRWRIPKLKATVVFDCVACVFLAGMWEYAPYALALALFAAMYYGIYWVAFVGLYQFLDFSPPLAVILVLSALCGLFFRLWECEYNQKLEMRDETARKLYEQDDLQSDLGEALVQVERMTAIAERTRIARDIHDNAGHEIVAAHITFLAARKSLTCENAETLELYDTALERLSSGMGKIRETAHNMQSITPVGAEDLSEACRRFAFCPIDCRTYGDTERVPMYAWNVLRSCLNECLTNIARHSEAKSTSVTLEAAQHIVRLCIENDGVTKSSYKMGIGLRNLRHRAAAIGGSLFVDAGETFRVVCVIPIKEMEAEDESFDC